MKLPPALGPLGLASLAAAQALASDWISGQGWTEAQQLAAWLLTLGALISVGVYAAGRSKWL